MKKNKKILIIEDEKAMVHALELKLTHAGFSITTTSNGADGLAILEQHRFALIVLDLVMPKFDGFKVLAALKERHIKTPVMVLTNLSQSEDEQRARQLGAVAFFIKSNTAITSVVEHIQQLLLTA